MNQYDNEVKINVSFIVKGAKSMYCVAEMFT